MGFLLGQSIIKDLIQSNARTGELFIQRKSLKKKVYVHKNYTTSREPTHVTSSKGVTQNVEFMKFTEGLFRK